MSCTTRRAQAAKLLRAPERDDDDEDEQCERNDGATDTGVQDEQVDANRADHRAAGAVRPRRTRLWESGTAPRQSLEACR